MTEARRIGLRGLPPLIAGGIVAIAGLKLFSGWRRIGPPLPDPFGVATGRGVPGTPPSAESVAEGYEVVDANGRDLAITIAVFAASAGLAIGGSILALQHFGGTPAAFAHLTHEQVHVVQPPEPRLQADPLGDLARLRAQQTASASGYGKLGHGLARIPVARAMALMEGKSLDPPGAGNETRDQP